MYIGNRCYTPAPALGAQWSVTGVRTVLWILPAAFPAAAACLLSNDAFEDVR